MKLRQHKNRKLKLISISILLVITLSSIVSLISLDLIKTSATDVSQNYKNSRFDEDLISTSQENGEVSWWNYSWQYRIPIDLASTNEDLTNYQVQIDLELTDWYEEGYLNETGKDIRFADSSNQELDFWIKNMNVTGGNSTIWVKIPELTTTGTRIYMYVGNPDAASASDGTKAFEFFDDFEGSSLDPKWYDSDTSSGSHVISGGTLKVDSGGIGLQDPLEFRIQDGYIVETKCLFNELVSGYSGTIPEISSSRFTQGSNGGGDANILYMRQNGQRDIHYWAGDGSTNSYNLGSTSTGWVSEEDVWYLTGISVIGGDSDSTAKLWKDGVNITTFLGINWNKDINYTSLGYFNGGTSNGQDTSYDWIRIRKYSPDEPTISIGEIEYSQLNITCLDIDGRRVLGANVYISNFSDPFLNQNGTTDENGEIIFRDIPTGYYNLTVNYTIDDGFNEATETVYFLEDYHKIEHELEIRVNLWTIDFQVDDRDGVPLDLGYINMSAEESNDVLTKVELDSNGEGRFIWSASKSYYNYSVYYHNPDYYLDDTFLYSGKIFRNETYKIYNINETAVHSSGYEYYVEDNDIYLYDDSGYSGPNKIVEIRLECSEIYDNLSRINVRFSGEDHVTTYTDEISADLTYKPFDEGANLYSIERLRVEMENITQSNGIIQLNLTHTYFESISVNMSKISLRVVDKTGESGVAGLTVKVKNNETSQSIVNLTTNTEGYAYGDFSTDFSFWYLNEINYNFSLYFVDEMQTFNVTETSKIKPNKTISWYDYKLTGADTIVFTLAQIDYSQYVANFTNRVGPPDEITWGRNMTFSVVYETSADGGTSWQPDYNRDDKNTFATIRLFTQKGTKLIERSMSKPGPTGNFSIEINSSLFSAGGSGKNYYARVYGQKALWNDPEPVYFGFKITPISSEIGLYNYSSLKPCESFSQYYNELINISLSYNTTEGDNFLAAEGISYSWNYGSGTLASNEIKGHPEYAGYYYFTLDTSLVSNIGAYPIDIEISKENYTTKSIYFNLEIKSRPTIVNNSIDTSYSPVLDILEARNFTLEYNDTLSSERVGGCEVKYYNWWKLDENGERSSVAGEYATNVENITETADHLYIIDFHTEGKPLGTYELIVHLQKNNYQQQLIFFSITIKRRTFSLDEQIPSLISVEQSGSIGLQISLTDTSAGRSGKLKDATLVLTIDGQTYDVEDSDDDGTYEVSIPASQYQTFFAPKTLACKLTISKANYETQEIDFSVTVGMVSVGPIPLFYLILGVVFSVALVGSLGTYRYIQVARIPEFVKRTRKIKKEIKGRKDISDKHLYQSKEEFIAEWYGDEWEELDLSIEKSLGLGKGSLKSLDKKQPGGGAQ